jgi:hypothetical protein
MSGIPLRKAKHASTAVSIYLDYGQPVETLTHKYEAGLLILMHQLLKLYSVE